MFGAIARFCLVVIAILVPPELVAIMGANYKPEFVIIHKNVLGDRFHNARLRINLCKTILSLFEILLEYAFRRVYTRRRCSNLRVEGRPMQSGHPRNGKVKVRKGSRCWRK